MTRWAWVLLPLALALSACSRQTSQASGRRMIVLGVDGMDPQFLEAHWNRLPNLNRLRQEGGFRPLGTTAPPQSPVAWSTVTTGLDPGGHGIFDFIHRNPRTRMPFSSMAESTPPARKLTLGPWVLPLSSGSVRRLRGGTAFWRLLEEHGVPSTVIRMPANFPPVDCEAQSLSGMGTPDMAGAFGTFSFFTDDPAETRTTVSGGRILRVKAANGRAVLALNGPANSFRRDNAVAAFPLVVHIDPTEAVARFDSGDERVILKQGEWSGWLRAKFKLLPGLKSVPGIFRIYLQQVHPHLRIYVSPVNIDPEEPALPISTPATFSRDLARALGPYYTQGIPEETGAYRAGILSKAEFLQQSHSVLADSLRMFRYELERFHDGLLFYYFSSVDQNAHMLWGKHEADLLEIYRGVDEAVGDAMRKAGPGTTLLVMSDHGFAKFDRAVHLNTWLMHEGLLALDDPENTSNKELFPHVDWAQTQAYAVGLNCIYLNLRGRETGGIVGPAEKEQLLDRISRGLLALRDPKTGLNVVGKVYRPDRDFRGNNLAYAPDLIVGFRRGYRASWQTALGAVPKEQIEDNIDAWIGDHCMAADEVPGVVLSNRKIRPDHLQLYDITATVLREFGVPRSQGMLGHSVFENENETVELRH
jgi:predicted AlkP superfamily phosphohydrolase/phosphomutase